MVVLLQGRDSKVVTAQARPPQGTHPPKGLLGDSFRLTCNADPCGQILGCERQQDSSASSPPTVPTGVREEGPRAVVPSMTYPHHGGP